MVGLFLILFFLSNVNAMLCPLGCATNAMCDTTTGTCNCNSDTPDGVATFFCFNANHNPSGPEFGVCRVQGDPHVTNFNGEYANFPIPCRFRSTEFFSQNCYIQIYGTNQMVTTGYVWLESVDLFISVRVESVRITLPHQAAGTVEYQTGTSEAVPLDGTPVNVMINGKIILVRWDPTNEMWLINDDMLDPSNCEFQLAFRPFIDLLPITSQSRLVGANIVASQDATFYPTYLSDFPDSICSGPQQTNAYQQYSDQHNFPKLDYGLINAWLNQSVQQSSSQMYFSQCSSVQNAFQNLCPDMRRNSAVAGCGIFLYRPLMTCVINQMMPPFGLFSDCVTAVCNGDSASCTTLYSTVSAVCPDGLEALDTACQALAPTGK